MSAHNDDRDNGKPNVAVVGRFQIGKSTLINCLLDDRVARTGEGISTTKISTIYTYGQVPAIEVARTWKDNLVVWESTDFRLRDFLNPDKGWKYISGIRISLWKPLLQQINLIDTPGIDANADDTARALASLDKADFAIVLLENKGLCDAERKLFADIRQRNLPFTVIVNCRDRNGKRWLPDHNDEIVLAISAELANLGIFPTVISEKSGVWPCNLLLFWHASEHLFEDSDGEELNEDITRYINKHLRKKATSSLTFQQSNFEKVRFFFEKNHWFKMDDDKRRNTVFIASPETVNFIQRFWDDQGYFSSFMEEILFRCWFSATPMYAPYQQLFSHINKGYDENNQKQCQEWFNDFAGIIGRYPLPTKFAWGKDSSKAMTDWLESGIRGLAEPYLINCTPDIRNEYLQRFQTYLQNIDRGRLVHEVGAVLFDLRSDYEHLAITWNELKRNAPGAQNYLKSGFFGALFANEQQTSEVFGKNADAAFNAMTQIIEQGNRLVSPTVETIIHQYWNGALEILMDIIQELANHGQDLSVLAYDTPESVANVPWIGGTVFHAKGAVLLKEVMENSKVSVDEKKRIYCLCRRIGIKGNL